MSQYSEDYNTIQEEVERKAQKPYRCDACREIIPRKIKCWAISWLFDGKWGKMKRCARCQKIIVHLREKCRKDGGWDEFPDSTLDCGHEYAERWGVEPPPEIAALAFALPTDEIT